MYMIYIHRLHLMMKERTGASLDAGVNGSLPPSHTSLRPFHDRNSLGGIVTCLCIFHLFNKY